MDDHLVQLRVSYVDLPDLIELGIRVVHGEWSAASTAYTSPSFLVDTGNKLLRWVKAPDELLRFEAGANTGIGWIVLEFYTIDRAGHARCAITPEHVVRLPKLLATMTRMGQFNPEFVSMQPRARRITSWFLRCIR
jgi:hypothetical protein